MKKILVGICIVLMVFSSSVIAIPSKVNDEEFKIQNLINNDLPDLIIEDIVIRTGHFPGEQDFYCKVKNIGNSPTPDEIEAQIIVIKLIFVIIPISIVFKKSSSHFIGGTLDPGETIELFLLGDDYFPNYFGIYKFYCTVNPNIKFLELQYNNNKYNEKHFVFLGKWF